MSDRLGHATVAFTQDVYIHAIPQMESDAADQIADLIFASSPTIARVLTNMTKDETILTAQIDPNGIVAG